MTVTQVRYPLAPPVVGRKGTLLDAATVAENNFTWQDGTGLFDSYNCLRFDAEANFCAANAKDLSDVAGWQDGFRFAAYGGITCKAIGLDQDDMLAQVRRAFDLGESTAVEAALMEHRFVANAAGAGLPGEWTAPEDITPAAGAVAPAVGVALLEGHAARNYVGAPTLHLPVTIAALIASVDGVEYRGDTLYTKYGSKVAAGAGYDYPNTGPTGAAAAVGEKWLYATGSVWVAPSEINVRQAMNTDNNEVLVLAERGYIAAVDCYTAAIRVTVTA
jgi:hypothetical protein